jgi:hypothetical protein
MTLYDFIALSDNEKAVATWNGEYLGTRFDGERQVNLYGLNNFYVEVYYDPVQNKIERMRPFNSLRHLEPYLHCIDIDGLTGFN